MSLQRRKLIYDFATPSAAADSPTMRLWQVIAVLGVARSASVSPTSIKDLHELQCQKELKKIELYHLRNKAKIGGSTEGMYGDRILDGMDRVDNAMSALLAHTALDPLHPQAGEYNQIQKDLFEAKKNVHRIFGVHAIKSGEKHFINGVTYDKPRAVDAIATLINELKELEKKEQELIAQIGKNPASETRQVLIQTLTRVRDKLQKLHDAEGVAIVKQHAQRLLEAVIALLDIAKSFDSLELYEEVKNARTIGKLPSSDGQHLNSLLGPFKPAPAPAPAVRPEAPISLCPDKAAGSSVPPSLPLVGANGTVPQSSVPPAAGTIPVPSPLPGSNKAAKPPNHPSGPLNKGPAAGPKIPIPPSGNNKAAAPSIPSPPPPPANPKGPAPQGAATLNAGKISVPSESPGSTEAAKPPGQPAAPLSKKSGIGSKILVPPPPSGSTKGTATPPGSSSSAPHKGPTAGSGASTPAQPVTTSGDSEQRAQLQAIKSLRNELHDELEKFNSFPKDLETALQEIKKLKEAIHPNTQAAPNEASLSMALTALNETEAHLKQLTHPPQDSDVLGHAQDSLKEADCFIARYGQASANKKDQIREGDGVIERMKRALSELSRIKDKMEKNNKQHSHTLKLAEANLSAVQSNLHTYHGVARHPNDKKQAGAGAGVAANTTTNQGPKDLPTNVKAPLPTRTAGGAGQPGATVPASSLEAAQKQLSQQIASVQKQEDAKRREMGQIPELERIKAAIRSGKMAEQQIQDIIKKNLHVSEHDNIKSHQANLGQALHILEEYVRMLEQHQAKIHKPSAAAVAKGEPAIKQLEAQKAQAQESLKRVNEEIEKLRSQKTHTTPKTPQEAIEKIREIEAYLKGLLHVSPSPEAKAALNEITHAVQALNMCGDSQGAPASQGGQALPSAPQPTGRAQTSRDDLLTELDEARKRLQALIAQYREAKAQYCRENPNHERCRARTGLPTPSNAAVLAQAEKLENALKEDIIAHPAAPNNAQKVTKIAEVKAVVDDIKKTDPALKAEALPSHKYNAQLTGIKEEIIRLAEHVKALASRLSVPHGDVQKQRKLFNLASEIKSQNPNSQVKSAATALQHSLDPSTLKRAEAQ